MEQPSQTQPPLMLTPFDPVEALLTDLAAEYGEALKQGSGAGHDFWEIANSCFQESRIYSFDTTATSFKESLIEKKDSFDYAMRFMTRMLLKPYFVEAIGTVHEHFLFTLDMIGFEGKVEEFASDPLIKLMMLYTINKPTFDEIRLLVKSKTQPRQPAQGRRS